MNQQVDWQKVIEWQQTDTTYIIHILINEEQLSIEIEDKFSGDIWQNTYTPNGIQDLTAKAKNQKKYPVFIKMLTSALLKSSQSLKAQILSYKQLSSRFGRQNVQTKTQNPQQNSKKFLILIYFGEFEKMQFPLPLLYNNEVSPERLKLTIKRMSQQLHLIRQGESQSEMSKQLALLKYENQSLKNKLKSIPKVQSNNSFIHPKVQELQKELNMKQNIISKLQKRAQQSQENQKQSSIKIKGNLQKIKQLQRNLRQIQKQRTNYNKNLVFYDQKLQSLMTQMKNLHDQLVNCRLKEQKSQQQIENLQTELQKMMAFKKGNYKGLSNLKDNSSSDKNSQRSLSVKSGRSNTSQKSLGKTRNINRKNYNAYMQQNSHLTSSNSKKQLSNKKPSIYDSDTQSSRMRRMANGRNSPYRQTANPANKKNQKLVNQINKSRSKSKEKQKGATPKQSVVYSQIMTEDYQSDSQREDQRIIYQSGLKKKKVVKQQGNYAQSSVKVNQKLKNLEQLIKKASQSKKDRRNEIK